MSFAVVFDVAASWERYGPVAASISDPAPAGLLLFAAGPTDEVVRLLAVWEDEEAWHRFQIKRLAPAMAAMEGPPPPPALERTLRVAVLAPELHHRKPTDAPDEARIRRGMQ